ncbi:histidine kinase [Actinotalea ferrariae CF5-4]|uniref:histidine kinase n=1 Tax=Actinotalea ferrariae CF5-4 TaxID=948458 RepID=A0A021VZT3_9CELL|nr:ATP-binding protein [Actinotalea ferrariae]EYR64582.1 histidine kinase [Actinotalea ferrariae CF5-4]
MRAEPDDAAAPATTPADAHDTASHADPWRSRSLRTRLTVLTAGLLCVTLIAGALTLTTVLSRSRVAELDAIVRDRAATTAELVAADSVPEALPVDEPGEIVQVLDDDGRVVATSPSASRTLPVLPPDEVDRLRAATATSGVVSPTSASAYDGQARVAVLPATWRGETVTVVATMPLAEVQGLLRALSLSLVGVVPTLTGILAVAVWLVLGRALHPVERMRSAAAQVARAGGPGSLPVSPADDEVSALARTLNEMLDRLETASSRQRRFVADAAHELRSPLATLRASLEVAREHPEVYRSDELAEDLVGEVLRMQGLVDDLLLLARVGSAPRAREEVDLADVARDAVGGSAAALRRPEVTVEVEGEGGALGDAPALGRVVRNLVDNAVRHATSRVRVTVRPGSVTVDDDGAGIPAEDRDRVFERFVRLDEAREREAGGSGLGLAIVREIAREHGGDVTLAAAPLGGLRARVDVPAP